MGPVRVACVRYLNTAPLVEGLDGVDGLELVPAVPSGIVDLLASGEADIGLASVVDAVRSDVPLRLLASGMIGCDGPTLTVRVFSSVPWGEVRTLHADTDSHTSVVLARVLLDALYGRRVDVAAFDARERVQRGGGAAQVAETLDDSWPATVLLIGDKVATDPPPAARYPHQLDLGEAWKAWTGLGFVYAAWMCRAAEANDERIRMAAALLDRQRRRNLARLGWIVARRAPLARWDEALAARYLGDLLRYDLDERARAGLARFLREAYARGIIEKDEASWAGV
ncbi:MAG: menaquinone biosynthesis protein [Planctomycetota bacterium]|nr:menaquinone biosynthesis protein [Planctomycetota bacterium]